MKELDRKKLQLYMENIESGFVLEVINQYSILDEIAEIAMGEKTVHKFQIDTLDEVDELLTMVKVKEARWKGDIILIDTFRCETEMLFQCCEKLNLLRDVLAGKKYLYLLCIPVYAAVYIQNELPNLYSYFSLKQYQLTEFASILDVILPDTVYLYTKEEYAVRKGALKDGNGENEKGMQGFLHTLDYLCLVKVSSYKVRTFLREQAEKYLKELYADKWLEVRGRNRKSDQNYDMGLLIRIIKMLQYQGLYEEARQYLLHIWELYRNEPEFEKYNVDMMQCLAANYYYTGDYPSALTQFSNCLSDLYMREEAYTELQISKYYNCIACCFFKTGEIRKASECIKKAVQMEQEANQTSGRRRFENQYNSLVILASMWRYEEYTEEVLMELHDNGNVIQGAMFENVKAWYWGVLGGKILDGLETAHHALEQEREFFLENSIQIAQSHYTIAVLYYMAGMYQRAERCCGKALNILKNFDGEKDKKAVAEVLKNKIAEMLR